MIDTDKIIAEIQGTRVNAQDLPKTAMILMPSGRYLQLPEEADKLTRDEIEWLERLKT